MPRSNEVGVMSAVRSPFGKFGGTLKDFTPARARWTGRCRGHPAGRDRPGRRRGGRHRRQPPGSRPLDRAAGADRGRHPDESRGVHGRPGVLLLDGGDLHGVALDPAGRHEDRRRRRHREHEPGALLPDRAALGPLAGRRRPQGSAGHRRPDDREAARGAGGRGGRSSTGSPARSRTPGPCAATRTTCGRGTPASSPRRSCRSRCPSPRASRSSSPRTSRCAPGRRSRSWPRCRRSTAAPR